MRSEPEKLIIQSYTGLDRLANVVPAKLVCGSFGAGPHGELRKEIMEGNGKGNVQTGDSEGPIHERPRRPGS
jgi:hypothetical protein